MSTHLRQVWARRVEGYGIGPTYSIYRGVGNVIIPYDERTEEGISAREIVDRVLVSLKAEGYGPEHPGKWWFIWLDESERIRQSRWWAGSFNILGYRKNPHTMELGRWASVGMVYEARFTSRPNELAGVSYLAIGTKLNIVAIHVPLPFGDGEQWQRVPVSFVGTVT